MNTTTPAGANHHRDLVKKYANDASLLREIAKLLSANKSTFTDKNEAHDLRAGDNITFLSGYNGDIRTTAKIWAFDKDGDALIIWDCYWFPINLVRRKARKAI